jgi:hypothetical protein
VLDWIASRKVNREATKSAKADAKKCKMATDGNQMHTDEIRGFVLVDRIAGIGVGPPPRFAALAAAYWFGEGFVVFFAAGLRV